MARPHKDGVGYFPLDTDFFYDRKVRLIRAQFGAKGVYIVLAILAEVYRTGGYYKKWDEDDCLLMSEDVAGDCSPQLITDVLKACLRRQLFDKEIFEMCGVITSVGIQRRYLRMVHSRDVIPVITEYWLLDNEDENDIPANILSRLAFKSVSGEKTPVSDEKNTVSSSETVQKKRKENKSKNKAKESKGAPSSRPKTSDRTETSSWTETSGRTLSRPPYDAIKELFNSVCASLPKVNAMPDARKKAAAARYGDCNGSLEDMRRFFERVEASDFLTGRKPSGRNWQANFDWIMNEQNFLKIQEGNYDNKPVRVSQNGCGNDRSTDNGRYPPTFDIRDVEALLDAEWNDYANGA